MKKKTILVTSLLLLTALALNACGPSATPEPTSTPVDIFALQTQAVAEFASGLTATALANPTATATYTPTPTFTPTPTSTGGGITTLPGVGIQPTSSCYSLGFVSDVTIPDNTPITPGQSFKKTWRVKNNGTCAWEAGFKFAFVGGTQMSGATVSLTEPVSPGQEINISVDFIAPTDKTGSIQSNWRMSTTTGTYFGDEVYVVITIGGSTATPTATGGAASTATSTSTATATPTPTESASP